MYKRYIELIKKFCFSLKHTGIKSTWKKVDIFIKNKFASRKLNKYAFDCFYQAKYINPNTSITDIKPIVFYSIANYDLSVLAARKPQYLNHYMPRFPLLYSNNTPERIIWHIKLAKEYNIYAFCYEVTDVNQYKNFVSALNLSENTFPFCLSISPELNNNDINTVLNITDFTHNISLDDKYIIILDCRNLPTDKINEFINSAYKIISYNIKNFQLWCFLRHTSKISNDKISKIIFYPDLTKITTVSLKNFKYLNKKTKQYLYFYDTVSSSLINYNLDSKAYKTVINCMDTIYNLGPAFYKYDLNIFYNWIKNQCAYLRDNFNEQERFLFIDSFNNWSDYSHIVPEKRTGYSFLNTMHRAINNNKIYGIELASYSQPMPDDMYTKTQICIQTHIFYLDICEKIVNQSNKIPYAFDIYVSTNTSEKADYIKNYFKAHSKAVNVIVEIFENKGRDVYPFIAQMTNYITKYKFICHIHSKKSKIDIFGDNWREYLFNSLFGSNEHIDNILKNLEMNKGLGIIFPKPFVNLENAIHWGQNKDLAENILEKLNINILLPVNNIVFPVGNMFWARVDAILPLFTSILAENFPNEKGQADGTTAHAIERLWVYIAEYSGYTYSLCGEK